MGEVTTSAACRCQDCGSLDVSSLGSGVDRCASCGSTWPHAVPVCGITTRHNHSSFDDPIDCAWRDRKPTWHSDIVRAGLDGLHRVPWWECDDRDEQPCRDTVYAVLTGLADAGYRLVAQDQPHSSDTP